MMVTLPSMSCVSPSEKSETQLCLNLSTCLEKEGVMGKWEPEEGIGSPNLVLERWSVCCKTSPKKEICTASASHLSFRLVSIMTFAGFPFFVVVQCSVIIVSRFVVVKG